MQDVSKLITDFGFPVVMSVGMGYFIYYIWQFISNNIQPELDAMHLALIKCIDQNRMLDNDMIRLQQKVNVVLEYREKDKIQEEIQEQAEKIAIGSGLARKPQNENKQNT